MAILIDSYPHRTGEHCASTALRNLLAHHGTNLSEEAVFGLSSGLGFIYLEGEGMSPTRMFHGRTATLEQDFCENAGIAFEERPEPDDDRAWAELRARLDAGTPVMISTDTFYLGYQGTNSHFPGHRCVVVGYDDAAGDVWIADRKFEEFQRCSAGELRHSRNAPDYPISCENRWGNFLGPVTLGRPFGEAAVLALGRNARAMLEPDPAGLPSGIPAMRSLVRSLPGWAALPDWSWAARFGYQVVIRRGAGGKFFRSLYAGFLREAGGEVPAIAESGLAPRMAAIADRWCELAGVLKIQSEREACDPGLFARAATLASGLADAEEQFFSDALGVAQRAG